MPHHHHQLAALILMCNRTLVARANNMFDEFIGTKYEHCVSCFCCIILNGAVRRVIPTTKWTTWFSLFGTVDEATAFCCRARENFTEWIDWLLPCGRDDRIKPSKLSTLVHSIRAVWWKIREFWCEYPIKVSTWLYNKWTITNRKIWANWNYHFFPFFAISLWINVNNWKVHGIKKYNHHQQQQHNSSIQENLQTKVNEKQWNFIRTKTKAIVFFLVHRAV